MKKEWIFFLFLIKAVNISAICEDKFYYSAITLSSGPHNTAFTRNISGISFNPAGIATVISPQILLSYLVTPEELSLLRCAFASSIKKTGLGYFIDFATVFSAKTLEISPRVGIAWKKEWFYAGTFYEFLRNWPAEGNPTNLSIPSFGILLKPKFLRTGVSHFIYKDYHETHFQVGTILLKNRLHISTGIEQRWLKKTNPSLNLALECFLWDFLSISGFITEKSFAAGFSLNAYSTRLGFAAKKTTSGIAYALSFNIQR